MYLFLCVHITSFSSLPSEGFLELYIFQPLYGLLHFCYLIFSFEEHFYYLNIFIALYSVSCYIFYISAILMGLLLLFCIVCCFQVAFFYLFWFFFYTRVFPHSLTVLIWIYLFVTIYNLNILSGPRASCPQITH